MKRRILIIILVLILVIAGGIFLYFNFFALSGKASLNLKVVPSDAKVSINGEEKDKDVLFKQIDKILDGLEFGTREKKQTQKIVWKKVLNKSFLTKREIFALFGFFKKF